LGAIWLFKIRNRQSKHNTDRRRASRTIRNSSLPKATSLSDSDIGTSSCSVNGIQLGCCFRLSPLMALLLLLLLL